ncbi:hypothetical protein BM1_10774 [Bipolaris maydis]|nr:hypothetical protein BM1_10774 [Bipolaris maydis]
MDETGVMLSKLGSVKVLVGKDDRRDYRGTGMKRTMVTAVECISADGRALLPLIIWPALTHRSNWTTYPISGWHYGFSKSGYNDSKISLEWLTRKGKAKVMSYEDLQEARAKRAAKEKAVVERGKAKRGSNIRMCEESEVSKVKVPLICPSTAGVPALRDGR